MERFAVISALFGFTLVASIALAAPFTYENDRFGTSATFPSDIFSQEQAPPENGDGLRWLSDDGASLAIFGSYNVLDETPKTREAAAKAEKDRPATYSRTGKNWVVLSGTDGDEVFYERYVFGPTDIVHGIVIEYPASLKAKYDPLVGRIAGSLHGP
ncbi:hypothetical protein ASD44_04400 [Mesorhizobium sp. Root554]|uniref:hypothetical protein n=1 Tax=unclassified Mesorhizobium TaxID=325217 RepID=UPI0006F9443B|nr:MULTISPECIES: hypothetical protein [unclassified Mesorhizobium]KQZ13401.1 hypothetical protein ASD27_04405 [Mesorhizobium sp. Root1471]KQZ35914.1 hypothetical protein ASD44_04400 [Mesorhizobium sp. Root554]